MVSSEFEGTAFTQAQRTSLQNLYPAYKKSTEVFIRWVCRYSSISIPVYNNGAGTRVNLGAFSQGVRAIAAQGIYMPSHVRSALEKSIALRNQVTDLYEEVEGTETSDTTRKHEEFTKKLMSFKNILGQILPRARYLGEAIAPQIPQSRSSYEVLQDMYDDSTIKQTDEVYCIMQELEENINDAQIMCLEEDEMMANLGIQLKILHLAIVIDQANFDFNVQKLSARSLSKAAWVAIAVSHLTRMICYQLAKDTNHKIENALMEIKRFFMYYEASDLIPLQNSFPAIVKTLNNVCATWTTYSKIELSPSAAAAYEACLRKKDLDTKDMLELARRVSSDAFAWCKEARYNMLLSDWMPHIPLIQRLMNHLGVPTEGNILHATFEATMILQTSATAAKASDGDLFSVASQVASDFLRSVRTFMNKIPLWIWRLFDVQVVENLNYVDRLIKQRTGDALNTATCSPWASGNLIIFTLSKLYAGGLHLIHRHSVVGAVLHVYNACLHHQACSPVPILDTAIALLSDVIVPDGVPPTADFKRSFEAYIKTQTPKIPEKKGPSKKGKSKGKGKTKAKPNVQPEDTTPDVSKQSRTYSVHPSLVMQFPSPDPNDDEENCFVSRLYAANAASDKGIPPVHGWTPLTLITQARAAATREFDGDRPRAAINLFAIFCVCVEVLNELRAAWNLGNVSTGDAWVEATVEKVERALEELDGGSEGSKARGKIRGLVRVLERFREKSAKEVFWELD